VLELQKEKVMRFKGCCWDQSTHGCKKSPHEKFSRDPSPVSYFAHCSLSCMLAVLLGPVHPPFASFGTRTTGGSRERNGKVINYQSYLSRFMLFYIVVIKY
jgi:hypothetical protein